MVLILIIYRGPKRGLQNLIRSYPTLFEDVPAGATVLEHDIDDGGLTPIKQHTCLPRKRDLMKKEVEYLLKNGLAEPNCSSPCLLKPKLDGFLHCCSDFHDVNAVKIPDTFFLLSSGPYC